MHRITESLRLENTSKISKSNHHVSLLFIPVTFYWQGLILCVQVEGLWPCGLLLEENWQNQFVHVHDEGNVLCAAEQQNLNDIKAREGWLVFVPLHTEEQISPMRLGTLPKNLNVLVNIYISSMWRSHMCLGFYYATQKRNTSIQESL